jgi:hypothetical protein
VSNIEVKDMSGLAYRASLLEQINYVHYEAEMRNSIAYFLKISTQSISKASAL